MRNKWIQSARAKASKSWKCEFYHLSSIILPLRSVPSFDVDDTQKTLSVDFGKLVMTDNDMFDFLNVSSSGEEFDAIFEEGDFQKVTKIKSFYGLKESLTGSSVLLGSSIKITFSYVLKK